ncbi:hypothetical protein [Mesorhizobium sp. Cs1299R1N3]|uniref:hypothetical protein n=1 Tax=Mesorhizobium sp. Cs1299R1N3 TaxID=3015173 RepID=UPI00301D6B94
MTANRLTTLELIADRCKVAGDAAYKRRAEAKTYQEANHVDMKSYRQGEAAAYNDAHKAVKAELERLRNRWQNGALSYEDFGLPS